MEETKLKKKEIDILEFLKKGGEKTETEIAFLIHSSAIYTKFYLGNLEKLKLIEKREFITPFGRKTTWWKLK